MTVTVPSGWTHVALNYIGPDNGQGIRIYHDGVQTGSDNITSEETFLAGEDWVVVGRFYTKRNQEYATVDVDELLFFNQELSDQEIMNIANLI